MLTGLTRRVAPVQTLGLRQSLSRRGYFTEVMKSGPLGYWRLHDTAGALAIDQCGPNNQAFTGGYVLNNAGPLTGVPTISVDFNGSTGCTSLSAPANYTVNRISIEAWIRIDSWAAFRCVATLSGATAGWSLEQTGSAGVMNMWVANSVSSWQSVSTSGWSLSTWYHVVGSYDADGKIRLYRNGALIGTSAAFTADIVYGSTPIFYISRSGAGAGNRCWDGMLSEVAYYNRALPELEVNAHYRAGLSGDGG